MSTASAVDNWKDLPTLPADSVFSMDQLAKAAPDPKVNLILGAYRDEKGQPYPLQVVRKAQAKLLEQKHNIEYQPILGHPEFCAAAAKLMLADSLPQDHVITVQGLGGTGSIYIGARFLAVAKGTAVPVYIPDPTWANHRTICESVGFEVKTYRYYKAATRSLDMDGLTADLQQAPDGSIFIFHPCAHNPTGVDPSRAQWDAIADLALTKGHQIFFDSAYQGYATGDLDNDAYSVRLFARKGIQFLLAQSFSKNMGLYGERVGALTIVLKDPATRLAVSRMMERIVRGTYSNPPRNGPMIAHLVLTEFREEWVKELHSMAERVKCMRQRLVDELTRLGTTGTWTHITDQIGMFSYLGLSKEQCEGLQKRRVFVLPSGRANVAALTEESVKMTAQAIDEVVRETTK